MDTVLERFEEKYEPEPNTGCWLWTAYTNCDGYGYFRLNSKTTVTAHSMSYTLANGPIQDGLEIDHLCRVRSCVNPDHLEAVSHTENVRRGLAGEVAKRTHTKNHTHCPAGHKYNAKNTYIYSKRPHVKECRICRRKHCRESKARLRTV